MCLFMPHSELAQIRLVLHQSWKGIVFSETSLSHPLQVVFRPSRRFQPGSPFGVNSNRLFPSGLYGIAMTE